MLKKFSVTGFKNFKETITMDFSDVRDYKFHPECITDGLLNTAIIYGKNAVGKTNFGLALFDIVSHLTVNSVTEGLYDYYLNQGETEYATFEYLFKFGDNEIYYKYQKIFSQDVILEYLELDSQVLLNTEAQLGVIDFDGLKSIAPTLVWDNKVRTVIKSYLIHFLYNSAIEKSHPLIKMRDFVSNMVFFRGLSDDTFGQFTGARKKAAYFDFIFDHIDEFNDLLKTAEIDKKSGGLKIPTTHFAFISILHPLCHFSKLLQAVLKLCTTSFFGIKHLQTYHLCT